MTEVDARLSALSTLDLRRRIEILDDQQAAITAALACMNDGRWLASESGADSLEAWLVALNPTWIGDLVPYEPLYTAEAGTPEVPPAELDIEWVGSPNYSSGRAGLPVSAIVIHTMGGTLAGCDSWFQNPASQVSSHYGIGLRGQQHQYVRLADSSWANGILQAGNQWQYLVGNALSPNRQTVTVETEDRGSGATEVTDEQYASTLAVCRVALQTYRGIRFLFGHNIISPKSRPNCCGDRWWSSGRFQALADELGLEAHF